MKLVLFYERYRQWLRNNRYYLSVGFIVGSLQAVVWLIMEPRFGEFPTLIVATAVYVLVMVTANRIFVGNWSGRRQFFFMVPFFASALSLTNPHEVTDFAFQHLWGVVAVAAAAGVVYKIIATASAFRRGMNWHYQLLERDAAMTLFSWSLVYWGAVDLGAKIGAEQWAMMFAVSYPLFALFGVFLILVRGSTQISLWRNWIAR
ncbi:MAG: hypothetical protein AAB486_01055 [Patescibacteria group bacterium]